MAIVTTVKKVLMRKYGTKQRLECDLFEGKVNGEEIAGTGIEVETTDYGKVFIPWANVAGIQWKEYDGDR